MDVGVTNSSTEGGVAVEAFVAISGSSLGAAGTGGDSWDVVV